MMSQPKISLFFGAGAEMPYGMPSGGKFALNIFREDHQQAKEFFKKQIKEVDARSAYANYWLPDNYSSKSVSVFGKKQYEILLVSSLENKRNNVFDFFKKFDKRVTWLESDISGELGKEFKIDQLLSELSQTNFDDLHFGHDIEINKKLNVSEEIKEGFLKSKYLAALLTVLTEKSASGDKVFSSNLSKILQSFFEILIGALGEDFLNEFNHSIFSKKPDELDFFDEISGLFSFDYKNMSGLEIVLSKREKIFDKEGATSEENLIEFASRLLDELFSVALDYQNLLDSYYRYLFSPQTDWGKFTKICIFLQTVHDYITQGLDELNQKILDGDGYYQDLESLAQGSDLKAIGTTNYNQFLNMFDCAKDKVFYLNGSTEDFYDPYLNKILTAEEAESSNHICVPFLFTQSGIKPLTSIKMSRRYVQLFDEFKESDVIGVVGFSFQSDDGHINGLFRELIEEHDKKVVIFDFNPQDISESKKTYARKLRLSGKQDNLIIEPINRDRQTGDISWYEKLIEHAQQQEAES